MPIPPDRKVRPVRRSIRVRRRGGKPGFGWRSGIPHLYMDPQYCVAFSEADDPAEYATYAQRLAGYAHPYTYVGTISTYAQATAAIDALTSEQKSGVVMIDLEFPWLAMLWRLDSEGVDAAWEAGWSAEIDVEEARQGITASTLAHYKTLAKGVNNDSVAYAKAAGCAFVVQYCYGSPPFSEPTGVPVAGLMATPPPSATSYFLSDPTYHPTLEEQMADRVLGGAIGDMGDAQAHADACTMSMYSFVASGDRASTLFPDTAIAGVTRKTGAGGAASPDFTTAVMRYWSKKTTQGMVRAATDAQASAVQRGSMSAANLGKTFCPIIWGPEVRAYTGEFEEWNHWMGPTGKGIAEWAEDDVGAFALAADADMTDPIRPSKVFVFADVRYYWVTLPTTKASADADYGNRCRRTRWALEVALFQRPCPDTGHPWGDETTLLGSTNQTDQDAFFDNAYSFLADGWWLTTANGNWWTVAAGNRLTAPCVLDQNSPLAPWLNFTRDIRRADVITAIRHWMSDRMCLAAAAGRTALGY